MPAGFFVEVNYDVGGLVQLHWQAPTKTVRWCGWLLVRRGEVNQHYAVYWLGPPYSDCHFKAKLRPIGHQG
ncbi:hypothetical protein Q5H92_00645 [Hymenobacter sp. M29]|uniref:Uncharacterized protein n=1 Tax=Hymenobacter mellowenesis TaxID=3063995 RepID=A0ABT9A5P5_9BACT|nr:hypothetical protein [Hymenobacter sp. M29]MDO7844848.1 hypothetical protein [Hymenobacter sp. M29]